MASLAVYTEDLASFIVVAVAAGLSRKEAQAAAGGILLQRQWQAAQLGARGLNSWDGTAMAEEPESTRAIRLGRVVVKEDVAPRTGSPNRG